MYAGPDGPNPYAPPRDDEELELPALELGQEQVVASRSRRLAGAVIDGLGYAVAMVPGLFSHWGDGGIGLLASAVLFVALGAIQCFLIATTGQTVGKRLLGMRIVLLDGSPCGFVHGVLLRSWLVGLIGIIPKVGGIISLVDVLRIFGAERRCLHDVLASTKVVMVDAEPS